MAEKELVDERLRKMDALKAAGMEAYPARVPRTHTIKEFLADFSVHEASSDEVSLAGRIMALREHGGIIFCDLYDGTGRVQVVFRKGDMPDEQFDLFEKAGDQGDFISATGIAFTTKRGEASLKVATWVMAAKSLMPMPSEWFGVKDEEARYRRRYLDIALTPELHDLFVRRSLFWNTIRAFLMERGFLEVETPVLETEPGGADARPFITHHNALDLDVHLRISAGELWQKRLLVAGFEKVFEIGRIFRNEGMSSEHAQDYTQLEFYQAYSDYEEGMKLVQELYHTIAKKVYGTTVFTSRGVTVDLGGEWPVIDYSDALKEKFNLDPISCSETDALKAAEEAGIKLEKGANKARAVDALWKVVRKGIAGPAFLVGVPVYLEPLAKRRPDKKEAVERFQILLGGSEMGKGFSELNDPMDQRARFDEQQKLRDQGDEEAQRLDEDFVEALEYGMPPAFGFGLSERLFSFFEGKSLRETQLFPLMRPKHDEPKDEEKNNKEA